MKRRGMALLGAIVIMVLSAILTALFLSFSTEGAKRTGDQYLLNQASLLAKSAEEFTILAIMGHDRTATGNCVNQVNITYPNSDTPMFDINVSVYYIGFGGLSNCNDYISEIETEESNGSLLLDITVTSSENILTEPVRYTRRAIQKL